MSAYFVIRWWFHWNLGCFDHLHGSKGICWLLEVIILKHIFFPLSFLSHTFPCQDTCNTFLLNYIDAGLERDQDRGSSLGADSTRQAQQKILELIFGLSFSVVHIKGIEVFPSILNLFEILLKE